MVDIAAIDVIVPPPIVIDVAPLGVPGTARCARAPMGRRADRASRGRKDHGPPGEPGEGGGADLPDGGARASADLTRRGYGARRSVRADLRSAASPSVCLINQSALRMRVACRSSNTGGELEFTAQNDAAGRALAGDDLAPGLRQGAEICSTR